jgi:hypothetical protein
MSLSAPETESSSREENGRAVLCAKCEHLNKWESSSCKRCGAPLFVSCSDCGRQNERVRTRCNQCGRRIHQGVVDRVTTKLSAKRLGITPLKAVLFALAMLFASIMIKYFAGMGLASPAE